MAAPLSQDLRRRLVQAVEAGSSARETARRLAISESVAIKLVQRARETSSMALARIGGYRKPLLTGHEVLLRELVAARGHVTLAEIKAKLAERRIEAGCLTTIWSTLRRLGLSHKNSLRAAEQDRTDVAEHRRMWRVWQRHMDLERFVFIDETGAATNMVRRYGWAPRTERLVTAASHGQWRTTTFVAGLRSTGLVAPLVLDGPMNGPVFLAYVEQFLTLTLRRGGHGQPERSQGGRCRGGNQRIGRQRPLSAILLAGPEPNRVGVRQVQGPAPRGRGPHQGGALDHHRSTPRSVQARRVPQLPHQLRI